MSQKVKKRVQANSADRRRKASRKRKKRNKRLQMLKRILLLSALSIVFLTAAGVTAVFVLNQKPGREEPDTNIAQGIWQEEKDSGTKTVKEGNKENKGKKKIAGKKESSAHDESNADDKAEKKSKKTNGSARDQTGEKIRKYIKKMTIEEKVAQLFMITPEEFTHVQNVVMAGDATRKALNQYPVGGLAYFKNNIQSEEQFSQMVKIAQSYSMDRTGLPLFIGIDEEGGTVRRISGRGFANVPVIPDMCQIGEKKDSAAAYDIGLQIGEYLSRFQVNVDFAPVADVYSNPDNTVVGKRAFGSDPKLVADMVANEVRGLKEKKVFSTLKHFPGHGNTAEDSHSGRAYSYKSLDELRSCELVPFQAGIDAGAEFVMAGHISLPNALGDDTPASLNYQMITEVLRGEMGFDGIVITDSLSMGAISNNYTPEEAAVRAVLAGVDLILISGNFERAYTGVLDALKHGRITEEWVDAALGRILKLKMAMVDAQP